MGPPFLFPAEVIGKGRMWSRSLDRVVAKMENGRTQTEPFPLSVILKVLTNS